jgi:hypothetical protein
MFVWDLPHYIMQHYFLLTPLVHIADILVLLMLETKKYKYKVAFEWHDCLMLDLVTPQSSALGPTLWKT